MNAQQIKTLIIGIAILGILIYIWFYLQFHNEPVRQAESDKTSEFYTYLNEIAYPEKVMAILEKLFKTREFRNRCRGKYTEVENFRGKDTFELLKQHFDLQVNNETLDLLKELEKLMTALRKYKEDDRYLLKLKANFTPAFTICWVSNDGKKSEESTFILDEVGISYLMDEIRKQYKA